MGAELASWNEWYHEKGLDWYLESDPGRGGFRRFMSDLGRLYLEHPALWELDPLPEGFSWIDCNDWENSVISYVRYGRTRHLVCVFNLTPVPRRDYRIGVPGQLGYHECMNSDSSYYGGSNVGNEGSMVIEEIPCHGFSRSISITLPPLSFLLLETKGD
jgi:1,4-alpha-glucan branching enzyme